MCAQHQQLGFLWVYEKAVITAPACDFFKSLLICKPSSCYFGVMKIEILGDNTPAPTPLPPLLASLHPLWAHAQAFARKAWYPTLNVCWLWLFRFLFDYSLQLNVNNDNKQINSYKFPIISHSMSEIIGPSIKTPLFSIFFFVLTHRASNNDTQNSRRAYCSTAYNNNWKVPEGFPMNVIEAIKLMEKNYWIVWRDKLL